MFLFQYNAQTFMEFDESFITLLEQNKHDQDLRILKLEIPIPVKYETHMNDFLEKFFGEDPFDIKPEDLEVVSFGTAKIKKLKNNRRPSTFLSLFRFLELYRIQLNSIKSDLNTIANCYKKLLSSDLPEDTISAIKSQILANILSAGKVIKKWNPQVDHLFRFTYANINLAVAESQVTNGPGKGFVNLRKTHSEGFLRLTFQPYYENLVNFCIICIAYATRLRTLTMEYVRQTDLLCG